MKGLIIIAHGSKKELSNNEFISFVQQIAKQETQYKSVEPAFLEIATPSIQEVTKSLLEQNIDDIYYYPYFLNSGKHVTRDIPKIVEELKEKYKEKNFTLLDHFGKSQKIVDIVLNDINF